MALLFYFTEKIEAIRRKLSCALTPNLLSYLHQYPCQPFRMKEFACLHRAPVSPIIRSQTLLDILTYISNGQLKMSNKQLLLPLHYQNSNDKTFSLQSALVNDSLFCPSFWVITSYPICNPSVNPLSSLKYIGIWPHSILLVLCVSLQSEVSLFLPKSHLFSR